MEDSWANSVGDTLPQGIVILVVVIPARLRILSIVFEPRPVVLGWVFPF